MSNSEIPNQVDTSRNADILNREELNRLLAKLSEDTQPGWGLMKPQNMVEHLIKVHQHTNGKKQGALRVSEEDAARIKQMMIYSDTQIPLGLKSPLAGETPDPFEFESLQEAKEKLKQELDDFESYHAANPGATFVQPRMGNLTYDEWVIFHNKHFTHHFKQFGLL